MSKGDVFSAFSSASAQFNLKEALGPYELHSNPR